MYAVYVQSKGGDKWHLIGFGKTKKLAEAKAALRLKVLPKGSKSKLKKVKQMVEAPEQL